MSKMAEILRRSALLALVAMALGQCTVTKPLNLSEATQVPARVTATGLLDCYPSGLKADSTNAVYAEASAAMKMGNQVLIAIDKPVPENFSPVFTVPVADVVNGPAKAYRIRFIGAAPFLKASKLEAFAKSPNDSLFFASTAFDRIRGSAADWDGYNVLLAWQKQDYTDVQYVAASERSGVKSSRQLRSAIQKALITKQFPNGAPYFKIEALAVLPGNRLIFGVREVGESYQQFEYAFILLETTFRVVNGEVQLDPSFKKVYDFQPVVNGRKMGISDLTYHSASNSLVVSTSYEELGNEKTKQLTSSLWILPLTKLEKGEALLPFWQDGKPLEFSYKAEGITLLDERTLLVIFDEDRKDSSVQIGKQTVVKQPHQVIYSIVKF